MPRLFPLIVGALALTYADGSTQGIEFTATGPTAPPPDPEGDTDNGGGQVTSPGDILPRGIVEEALGAVYDHFEWASLITADGHPCVAAIDAVLDAAADAVDAGGPDALNPPSLALAGVLIHQAVEAETFSEFPSDLEQDQAPQVLLDAIAYISTADESATA